MNYKENLVENKLITLKRKRKLISIAEIFVYVIYQM